jgi:hypothetical protein
METKNVIKSDSNYLIFSDGEEDLKLKSKNTDRLFKSKSPFPYTYIHNNKKELTGLYEIQDESNLQILSQFKEKLEPLIRKSLNSKLIISEMKSEEKEREIVSLMYSLHSIKSQLENFKFFYKDYFNLEKSNSGNNLFRHTLGSRTSNKNYLNESVNRSTHSSVSRRSFSNSTGFKGRISKITKEEKHNLMTQKVSINIGKCETLPNERKKSSSKGRYSDLNSEKQIKMLEKNLKPRQTTNATSTTPGNKFSYTNKLGKCPFPNKYSSTKNPVRINSGENTDLHSRKLFSNINQVKSNKSSFKFEPKKKFLSNSGSVTQVKSSTPTQIKSSFKSEASNSVCNLPVQLKTAGKNFHSRNGSECTPKNLSNGFSKVQIGTDDIYGINHLNTLANGAFSGSIVNVEFLNEKSTIFFNSTKNSAIFKNIFGFLNQNSKGALIIKNISKHTREAYFDIEISQIEKVVKIKNKQTNPLYKITITNLDIFSKKLILSNYKKYYTHEGFMNLIKVLYIILSNNIFEDILNALKFEEMVIIIENSVNGDKNLYSKYKEIIDSLRNSKNIYLLLESLHKKHDNYFSSIISFIKSRTYLEETEDFEIILELIESILKFLKRGVDMGIIIDIEILNYRLEVLKNFKNQK